MFAAFFFFYLRRDEQNKNRIFLSALRQSIAQMVGQMPFLRRMELVCGRSDSEARGYCHGHEGYSKSK